MKMTSTQHLQQGPLTAEWIQQRMAEISAGNSAVCLQQDIGQDGNHAESNSSQSGAIASFLGVIRADQVSTSKVVAIEYTAYEPLAERLFSDMERDVARLHDLHSVHIWHALGRVEAGQTSMLVVVSAAHRAEVFNGLRAAVEAVKAGAPVWKRELLEDGDSRWVENSPVLTEHKIR